MRRRRSRGVRQRRTAPTEDRWLLSYADLITLLFALFTALFAASKTDKGKLAGMQFSTRQAFATPFFEEGEKKVPPKSEAVPIPQKKRSTLPTSESQHLLRIIERISKADAVQGNVQLERHDDRVVLSLSSKGFFNAGSAGLRKSSLPVLAVLADKLTRLGRPLRIEGHTDSMPPRGQFVSNWSLSAARAASIANYLSEEFAYPADLMHITGFAATRPRYNNDTAEGRVGNRRVSIVVLLKNEK